VVYSSVVAAGIVRVPMFWRCTQKKLYHICRVIPNLWEGYCSANKPNWTDEIAEKDWHAEGSTVNIVCTMGCSVVSILIGLSYVLQRGKKVICLARNKYPNSTFFLQLTIMDIIRLLTCNRVQCK
jgi:hypothetical protein